jgi:putative membrane protein
VEESMSKTGSHGYSYYRRYLLALAAVFMIEWVVLAIDPKQRTDWVLENILVVFFAVALVFSYRHLLFSRLS